MKVRNEYCEDIIGKYSQIVTIDGYVVKRIYEFSQLKSVDEHVDWSTRFYDSGYQMSNLSNLVVRHDLTHNEFNLLLYLFRYIDFDSNFICESHPHSFIGIKRMASELFVEPSVVKMAIGSLYNKGIVSRIVVGNKICSYLLNGEIFPAHVKYNGYYDMKRFLQLAISYDPQYERSSRETPEYAEWRKSVFIRDSHICQACGATKCELHAHHVLNYSSHVELRTVTFNGITLCKSCHREFHHLYGNRNNNRDQIDEFIMRRSNFVVV